jgi:uncharacterized membrane protein
MINWLLSNVKFVLIIVMVAVTAWFINSYITLRVNAAIISIKSDMQDARENLETAARNYESTIRSIERLAEITNEVDQTLNQAELVNRIEDLENFDSSIQAGPATKKAIDDLKKLRKE